MGSYNSNPGPEINPELKQKQKILQELNPGEKPMISSLLNSVHYLIQYVFILRTKEKSRLETGNMVGLQ